MAKVTISIVLDTDLLRDIERMAQQESRSRSNAIERLLACGIGEWKEHEDPES